MLSYRFNGDSRIPSELCRSAGNLALGRGLREHGSGSGCDVAQTDPRNRNDRGGDLTVDIKTMTSHKVPFLKLKAWLKAAAGVRVRPR